MRTRRLGTALAATVALTGLLPATVLAATPTKGPYKGHSDQADAPDNGVELRVDRHHKVARFAIDWSGKCDRPNKFWDAGTEIKDPKNDPIGTFHDHGKYTSKTDSGFTGRVTLTVDGHFTDRTHATGEWKASVKVYNPNGNRVDTCSVKTHWHVGPA
jgi:hypothetical protein